MNFFDNLVLPQSSEHIELLHYILMMIMFLFVPFISILFGGSVLSVYYRRRGLNENNPLYIRFAYDLIETLTINKSIGIILGIVPLLTSILIYTQLLHSSEAFSVNYLVFSFLFTFISVIFIYTYRYSVVFSGMFESIKELIKEDDKTGILIKNFRDGNRTLGKRSGNYGVLLLFIALFLFVVGVSNSIYPVFSVELIVRFLQFLAAAFAVTGGAIFFMFFYWDGGKNIEDDNYKAFVKKIAMNITFSCALVQPFFLTFDIIYLPSSALSGAVFTYGVIAILLIFVVYHLLYSMIRNSDLKMSGPVFYVLIFSMFAVVVKDQLAMSNSTRLNSEVLALKYNEYLKEITGENKAIAKADGEQIYKNICSSCHSFDHKIVGPPYKQTLPKYEGKLDQLVAFIRNPSKKNPDYPPMPNPGLKPNEAQAVAEWLLKTYKSK
jgi:cytochrome c